MGFPVESQVLLSASICRVKLDKFNMQYSIIECPMFKIKLRIFCMKVKLSSVQVSS